MIPVRMYQDERQLAWGNMSVILIHPYRNHI